MKAWINCMISILVFLCCIRLCISHSKVDELCNGLLPDDYEIYNAPDDNGNPVEILVGFQVLDIDEIDEDKMDYRLHTFIMQFWNDSRLKLDKHKIEQSISILYAECRHYFWTPDIFFENAKKVETFENTSPTTCLTIWPDGALIMSTRYSFKVGCEMNFEDYPFDTQNCKFLLALMFSTDNVARLKWVGDSSYGSEIRSVQMAREAHPLQFSLQPPITYEVTEVWVEGNYTTLIVDFPMVRRLTGSIVNTFAPSTLIVSMSWVTFWLKADAVPARVALSVTSLLTLCTQVEQYKSQLPPVNYIKAMDIWLFVCIFMVFSTLIVFAVSYNMNSKKCSSCSSQQGGDQIKKISNCCPRRRKVTMYPLLEKEDQKIKLIHSIRNTGEIFPNTVCQGCVIKQSMGTKIDEACRKLFPGIFLIFAIAYWAHYLRIYNNQCHKMGVENCK